MSTLRSIVVVCTSIFAGCSYAPSIDVTCEAEGAVLDGAICRDGVWVTMDGAAAAPDEGGSAECEECTAPTPPPASPERLTPPVIRPELVDPGPVFGPSVAAELRVVFDRPAAEDLDDFVALVDVQSSAFAGEDVVFVDVDGDVLDHDIESFDRVSGHVVAWVRLPVLAATGDTTITVRVADPSDDDPDARRVWDDYEAVFHLRTEANAADRRDGRNHGSVPAAGQIGDARSFDGDDQWIDTRLDRDLDEWSVSVWVNGSQAPSRSERVNGPLMRDGNYEIIWDHPDDRFAGAAGVESDDELYYASFGVLQAGEWHHLAATFDGEELRSFHNGTLVAVNEAPDEDPEAPNEPAAIGRSVTSGRDAAAHFAGIVDEVRVTEEVRSPAWFEASYRNQLNPAAFYTVID